MWAAVILGALQALAWTLRHVWLQGAGSYALGESRRWLISCAVGGAALYPVMAAFLGAKAIPTRAEAGYTQAALLTHLRPFEFVMGRLLAEQWPLLMALAMSCGFWLVVSVLLPAAGGIAQVLLLHLVLLSAVYVSGAIAALSATRSVPGRAWERGVTTGLLCVALSTTALLLANPLIRHMDDPVRLIESALVINPVVAATTTLQLDLLRTPWLYARTDAPDYEFAYPSPWATVGLFCAIGLVAQAATARRLRHAFY
jgi:hypothetical protein